MRILIISRSFYPEISPRSFRTTELAKEFSLQGLEVHILTIVRGEDQKIFATNHGIVLHDLGPLIFKPIKIAQSGLRRFFRRILFRGTNLFLQYPDIELMWRVKQKVLALSVYDMIISIAVPHPIHWGMAWAKKQKPDLCTTWIADCGDPFMIQENDTFNPPFYFGYLEKWFCRKCDYITVPVVGAKDAYFPEFREKIRVIPQGFKFPENGAKIGLKIGDVPEFAYAGSFIPGRRDPRPILEYLGRIDTDFVFHIYTTHGDLIRDQVEELQGKVVLHDIISRDILIEKLRKMDFLLNIENVGEAQQPSKLIDYAIVGRPILSVKSSELDQERFVEFLNGNYENRLIVRDIDQYQIENVTNTFIELHNENVGFGQRKYN